MLYQHQQQQHQHQPPVQQHYGAGLPVGDDTPYQQYNNINQEPFLPIGLRRERWVLTKTLGSGGFGTVTLWRDEVSGEDIAIKKCRIGPNLSHKSRQRWQIEVDIMKKLKHDNVVSGLEVPPGLESLKDDLPLLAMEYCAGGDLRKALNNPKNCCGMSEFDVRCLSQDISSAIEYLHSKRIIHRDLKPENIVLQSGEQKTIYKLIDLGYAKELDKSSVCHSFVGTLQYLAPELFVGQKYTQTVDYWSFGTVIFECLTGSRPFLPSLAPIRWHKEVNQKSQDDICAYFENGDVRFSKKLFTPNHLTRTMQSYFENWLRLMLKWDPKSRGGGVNEDGKPNCFVMLNSILNLKISNILYVEANQLISVPVPNDQTMQDLQHFIHEKTKIPPHDQDILLASGLSPDNTKPASQCWSEPGDEEWLVYLFKKSKTTLDEWKSKQQNVPQMVQYIIKEPKTILSYSEQKKAWAHAVYFCQEQNRDFKRLIGSQRATMLSLLRANSEFVRMKSQMLSDVGQMMAKKEQFKESLELDMSRYNDQVRDGISSELMFSKWQKTDDDIEKFNDLKKRSIKLEQEADVLQARIVELQRSPYSRGKPNTYISACEEDAKTLFSKLRNTARDTTPADHTKMVEIVTKCIIATDRAVSEMLIHISKICSCRNELAQILPKIKQCCEDTSAACKQLSSCQRSRQIDLWNLIKVALGKAKQLSRSNSRKDSSLTHSSSPRQSVTSMSANNVSLLHSVSRNESMAVMRDSRDLSLRNYDMIKSLRDDHDESLSLSSALNAVLEDASDERPSSDLP